MIQHLDQDLFSYLVSFLPRSDRAILVENLKHLNRYFFKLFDPSSSNKNSELNSSTVLREEEFDDCLHSESLMKIFDNLYIPTIHVKANVVQGGGELMEEMIGILKRSEGVECLLGSDKEFLVELEFPDEKMMHGNGRYSNIWELLERSCKYWVDARVSLIKLFTEWKYSKKSLNSETLSEYSNRNGLILNVCRLVNKFRIHLILDNDTYSNHDIWKYSETVGFQKGYFRVSDNSIPDMAISILANMMSQLILPKMDTFCNLPLEGLYSEMEMKYIRATMRLNQWNLLYKFLNIQQNIICRHMSKVFHSNSLTIVKQTTKSELYHKNAEDIIYIFSLIPMDLLQTVHRIRLVKIFLENFYSSELNISDEYREKYIQKFPDDAMHSNGIHIFDSSSSSPLVSNQKIQFTFETVQFFKKCFATIRQNCFYMPKYPSLSLKAICHEISDDLIYTEDTTIGKIDRICVENCIRGVTAPIFFIPCVTYWSMVGLTCSCINPYLYKDGKSTIMSCLDYDIFNYVFWSTGCYPYSICTCCLPLEYAEVEQRRIDDNKFRHHTTCNIL
ncbi:predicted protein [Naegleria gruberi]|uniref:Predicted protein n=1 Tax=Naegleria gruberi TaxID=5762 RepID=D2VLQ3_NAEGR|nr:uncharacterized protein NAEGRDRAFT_69861 [Naegleria gruberi]EFC42100.1 predicted protein [Naegleria gruberi]|eukprot:XP_002674844.1 predicted protein [Naegleria gruberi strain NEG-M]